MSPWSRTILRRCSGGISSCFESMYPNFFLSEYRLEFSFCHFRAFSSKIASRCSALIVDAMMPLIHTSLKSRRYQLVHAQCSGEHNHFFIPNVLNGLAPAAAAAGRLCTRDAALPPPLMIMSTKAMMTAHVARHHQIASHQNQTAVTTHSGAAATPSLVAAGTTKKKSPAT
jgi:hypothetical protein